MPLKPEGLQLSRVAEVQYLLPFKGFHFTYVLSISKRGTVFPGIVSFFEPLPSNSTQESSQEFQRAKLKNIDCNDIHMYLQ